MVEQRIAESGFVVLPTEEGSKQEDLAYVREIEHLCGATLNDGGADSIRKIYRKFLKESRSPFDAADAMKLLFTMKMAFQNPNLGDREGQERAVRISFALEAIQDRTGFDVSYGTFAHCYLESLKDNPDRTNSSKSHRALLVGALSPITVREFGATVRAVYPDSENLILDPEGVQTVEEAKERGIDFLYASADKIPFSEALDSIHSSYLMTYISNGSFMGSADRIAFFAQAHQALKNDGILLMSESKHHDHGSLPKRRVIKDLEKVGFGEVEIEEVGSICDRRALDRFYRGNSTEAVLDLPHEKKGSYFIKARKVEPAAEKPASSPNWIGRFLRRGNR